MAPKSPKMSQDGAQERQDEPRWRPRAPRWRPRGRQMQPRWRSWLDVGSFWDQFLMIVEASWLSGCIPKNFEKLKFLNVFSPNFACEWGSYLACIITMFVIRVFRVLISCRRPLAYTCLDLPKIAYPVIHDFFSSPPTCLHLPRLA